MIDILAAANTCGKLWKKIFCMSAQTAFCFFCRLKDYNVSFFRCKAGACMKNALHDA